MIKNKIYKKEIVKGIVLGIACAVFSVGVIVSGIACGGFKILSERKEAEVYDNYRAERIEKLRKDYETGKISHSSFDAEVHKINALEDTTIRTTIWTSEEHKDCCDKLFWQSTGYSWASVALGVTTAASAFGAILTGSNAGYTIDNADYLKDYDESNARSARDDRKNRGKDRNGRGKE